VALFVPPLSNGARRYDVIETVQFALAALALPALVTMGAPWRVRHASGSQIGPVTVGSTGVPPPAAAIAAWGALSSSSSSTWP